MDLNVEFLHPSDGRRINVTLDASITATEAIAELIGSEFVQPLANGEYTLGIKGGNLLEPHKSFEDSGVVDGSTIRIIPSADAVTLDIIHERKKEGKTFSIYGEKAFHRIEKAVGINLDNLQENIVQARKESNQFFKLTLIFSGLGFLIIAFGVILLFLDKTTAGIITAVSSIVPEVTALLLFAKDKELRRTIQTYHQYMLDSQRLLTMVDLSETIEDTKLRDKTKQDIVYKTIKIQSALEGSSSI